MKYLIRRKGRYETEIVEYIEHEVDQLLEVEADTPENARRIARQRIDRDAIKVLESFGDDDEWYECEDTSVSRPIEVELFHLQRQMRASARHAPVFDTPTSEPQEDDDEECDIPDCETP